MGFSLARNWRKVHIIHLAREKLVREIWRYSCWEKGNFILIYELKYDQTWKIWPSALSLSLYNTFNISFMLIPKTCRQKYIHPSPIYRHIYMEHHFLNMYLIQDEPSINYNRSKFFLINSFQKYLSHLAKKNLALHIFSKPNLREKGDHKKSVRKRVTLSRSD